MSNEFKEKLQRYKEGKLNQEEIAKIEAEMDKFIAISEYLNNDEKEFFEELKQQIPTSKNDEGRTSRKLKRRVNLRIVITTALTVVVVFWIFLFGYFTLSKSITSWFGLDYKEQLVNREIMSQFSRMLQPEYKCNGSGSSTLGFAQQKESIYLDNTVGNTNIEKKEVSVKFSFGKPVKTSTEGVSLLIFDNFIYPYDSDVSAEPGFRILENAPQGTKAKVWIGFNKALTPQGIKENFINAFDNEDNESFDITPIAICDSKFFIANPSFYQCATVYPYDLKNNEQSKNRMKQIDYDNMDNQAHKESLIGNLRLIKNNKKLLQVMYNRSFENMNMDNMIKQVENNGVEYIGMYLSADTKEILKLKDSSLIKELSVVNIVIW